MKKLFLIFFYLSLSVVQSYSAIDLTESDVDYLSQADGLSTDLSGSNQKITMSAWINLDESDSNGFISKENTTNGNRQYGMLENSSLQLSCNISSAGSANSTAVSTTTFGTGQWYAIGCVYDDVDIRPYINGALDGTPVAHTAGIFNGTAQFRVGERSGVSNATDGRIDDVCVWNTNLTAAEMSLIYISKIKGICRQIKPSNLVLYCDLDECANGATCTGTFSCSPGSNLDVVNTPLGFAQDILTYP